jgi:hypothetical protein
MNRTLIWLVWALSVGLALPAYAQEDEADALEAAPSAEAEVAVDVEPAPEAPATYEPLFAWSFGGMDLQFPLEVSQRVETVSPFAIDGDGTDYETDPIFDTRARLGAQLNTNLALAPIRVVARLEGDVVTGIISGGSDTEGVFVPAHKDDKAEAQLRVASLQLDFGPNVHLIGGAMTSHWGMGLLANDGAHGWTPGSAQFTDPRGGDRVLRGMLLLGPLGERKLAFAVGADRVLGDDVLINDDKAVQGVVSLVYGFGTPYRAGVYVAARNQTTDDGASIRANAFDAELSYTRTLNSGTKVSLDTEIAVITGTTTLGPSADFPEHDIMQVGAALRLGVDWGSFGFVIDGLFTSGDDNLDDGEQNAFRTDKNYPLGLVAHTYLLAAQTARAPITASNPDLVGVPSADLDRLPTRGAITNTLALFPRAFYRPGWGLELYGGPLFLLTPNAVVDPFNTRVNGGGEPRNALNGGEGSYLGTELDGGIRYNRVMWGTQLTLGVEGGVLLPGKALADAAGATVDPVTVGRAMLNFKF